MQAHHAAVAVTKSVMIILNEFKTLNTTLAIWIIFGIFLQTRNFLKLFSGSKCLYICCTVSCSILNCKAPGLMTYLYSKEENEEESGPGAPSSEEFPNRGQSPSTQPLPHGPCPPLQHPTHLHPNPLHPNMDSLPSPPTVWPDAYHQLGWAAKCGELSFLYGLPSS